MAFDARIVATSRHHRRRSSRGWGTGRRRHRGVGLSQVIVHRRRLRIESRHGVHGLLAPMTMGVSGMAGPAPAAAPRAARRHLAAGWAGERDATCHTTRRRITRSLLLQNA